MLLSAGVSDEQQADVYYLQQLIRFATLKERSLKREFIGKAFAGVPGLVIDLIVRSFTTKKVKAAGKTSRHRGVSYITQSRKWKAVICVDSKRRHLGVFADEDAAAAAYVAACHEIGRDPAQPAVASGGDDRLSKTTNGLGDKLIVHILILALHVSKPEFVLSPEALATDLQLAPIKLVLYLREIGCRIQTMNKNGNKLYRASLQAPLKFPSAPKRRSSGPSG